MRAITSSRVLSGAHAVQSGFQCGQHQFAQTEACVRVPGMAADERALVAAASALATTPLLGDEAACQFLDAHPLETLFG